METDINNKSRFAHTKTSKQPPLVKTVTEILWKRAFLFSCMNDEDGNPWLNLQRTLASSWFQYSSQTGRPSIMRLPSWGPDPPTRSRDMGRGPGRRHISLFLVSLMNTDNMRHFKKSFKRLSNKDESNNNKLNVRSVLNKSWNSAEKYFGLRKNFKWFFSHYDLMYDHWSPIGW